MSLKFSNTSSPYDGILQQIEIELFGESNLGHITGNAKRLGVFTTQVNLAWDYYLYLAFKASGRWQYDDSNHTKYPIIYADLESGKQDYSFTTDEQGNLILDIYKVMVLSNASATLYEEIYPVDQQQIEARSFADDIAQENSAGGAPYRYDKTANGFFLTPIPDYEATKGLKVYINREANYFTTSDTTKKPGCPGLHHRYFVIRPAYDYARRNNLPVTASLREELISFEGDEEKGITGSIERYFARRKRDERNIMRPRLSKFI